jgi:iron complex transport system substrate-binding protein
MRLISLNPSLTAIILKLGAADSLIAVDDYSAQLFPEETAELPRVGGLFNPNLESIVALRPDEVLLVAGVDQQTHGERIARAGVETEVFENERLDQVLENIDRLGRMLGKEKAAEQRIRAIRVTRAAVTSVASKWPSPATVAVLDRSPFYVVGGETFLDEMLEAVGAKNLGRQLGKGYPRGSVEWLIAAAPVLLIDMTPDEDNGMAYWKRWPSLPAVVSGRVLTLEASRISLPGAEIDRALVELAAAVHGPSIASEIEAERVLEKLR